MSGPIVGDVLARRELQSIHGDVVRVPDGKQLIDEALSVK